MKNALVSSDANKTAAKATTFLTAIKVVDMNSLSEAGYNSFMTLKEKLIVDAAYISESNEIEKQRDQFKTFQTIFLF